MNVENIHQHVPIPHIRAVHFRKDNLKIPTNHETKTKTSFLTKTIGNLHHNMRKRQSHITQEEPLTHTTQNNTTYQHRYTVLSTYLQNQSLAV